MINTDKAPRFDGPNGERYTNNEMVDIIVSKTGVTAEQAQEALDKNNHDLLDSMIYVERTYKKASAPQNFRNPQNAQNAAYTAPAPNVQYGEQKAAPKKEDGFGKFLKFIVNNSLTIYKDEREVISLPIVVVIAATLASVSGVLLIAFIAMFFDVRYRLTGPDVAKSSVNVLLDSLYGMARTLKTSLTGNKY